MLLLDHRHLCIIKIERGPRTDPLGTQQFIGARSESKPFMGTC